MKAVYDKLLLLLALIVLAGSAAYFFFVAKGDSAVARGDELLSKQPTGTAYKEIPAPQFERKAIAWPAPAPQDAEGSWLFDVFTPPRIYWDPVAKKLVSEPWQPPLAAPPFGLELKAVEQELFRIQLEGYFASSDNDPNQAQILLVNVQDDVPFRGKVGSSFENHKVRIDKFETKRESNPDGSLVTVAMVTITDVDSGQSLTLTTSEKLYLPGKHTITVATVDPLPAETIVWKAVGDKHQSGEVTFVLDAFDVEAKNATVTKTSPKLEKPEQQVLNVKEVAAPAASAAGQEGTVNPPAVDASILM